MRLASKTQIFFHKHARTFIALFFLLILFTGFLSTPQYGHAWDDVGEMNILRMALKEYASILPFDTEYKQTLDEMPLPRMSESDERDHGICAYYPLFWAFCRTDLPISQLSMIWRLYTWMVFTAGLFALYACARQLGFSRPLSCIGVLIMLLSPRLFAAGHYNNKDIPLMALTLMLLWQTARLMKKPSLSSGIGFAFAAGFCAGTRVIGVALFGLCGLIIILHLHACGRLNRRVIGIGITTVLLSILIYILLTPSFLADPLAFIQYIVRNAVSFSRWSGSVLFLGRTVSSVYTKAPRIYLPVIIAVTTPLWILALLAIGCFILFRRVFRERLALLKSFQSSMLTLTAACWILPLLGGIAVHMMVYNGWRHLYFLYGPMILCMIYGINHLWHVLHNKRWLRCTFASVLTACMIFTGAGIAMNHPVQYGYYNILVPQENRAAIFEMDYWNLSCQNALEELLAKTEGPIRIAASDKQTCSGLETGASHFDDERLFVIKWYDTETVPNYVISNLSYAVMAGYQPADNLKPVVTISSYGCPVTVIYEVIDNAL